MEARRVPALALLIFLVIGAMVGGARHSGRYFLLFCAIGALVAAAVHATIRYPERRQAIRLVLLCLIGGGLFFGLSVHVGVNFQFPQIVFDASAGVVAGALIQFVVARLVLPFVFGNGFCSRACWDGAVFELAEKRMGKPRRERRRSELLAWSYLAGVVLLAAAATRWNNPATDEVARRWWILGENALIIVLGLGLPAVWGRRAYCRMLCPFITVSGLLSRFSLFKIAPTGNPCVECELCNRACPMMVDVMTAAMSGRRVQDRSCILCERCVDACPKSCLEPRSGSPWN